MMDPKVTQVTSLQWLELVSWLPQPQSDQEVQFYNVPKRQAERQKLGELTVFLNLIGGYAIYLNYIQGLEQSIMLNFIKKPGHICFVKILPVNLCFCGGEDPEKHIFRQMRFKQEKWYFFLPLAKNQRCSFSSGLGQEQELLLSNQALLRRESKYKKITCVCGAKSSQVLNNVKITKTKYIFTGCECEDVNKGKGDYLKWKILPC